MIINKVKQNHFFFLLEEKGKNKKDRGSEIEWGGEALKALKNEQSESF